MYRVFNLDDYDYGLPPSGLHWRAGETRRAASAVFLTYRFRDTSAHPPRYTTAPRPQSRQNPGSHAGEIETRRQLELDVLERGDHGKNAEYSEGNNLESSHVRPDRGGRHYE